MALYVLRMDPDILVNIPCRKKSLQVCFVLNRYMFHSFPPYTLNIQAELCMPIQCFLYLAKDMPRPKFYEELKNSYFVIISLV